MVSRVRNLPSPLEGVAAEAVSAHMASDLAFSNSPRTRGFVSVDGYFGSVGTLIRPLHLNDMTLALAIQAACYPPEIRDGKAAFASRIAVAPDWCWAAEVDGRLAAYLFSHPWVSMLPPPVDTVLEKAEGDVWYIHDLSVVPWARGQGLGDDLLATCRTVHPDISRSELVAIPGAAPFWERRGWHPTADSSPALDAKVARYGVGSAFLVQDFT